MANPWDNDPVVDPFEDALKAEGLTGKAAAIARSIYQQESSSGKNTKTSNAGAVGGMQIIPATFKSVADKDWDINDPTQNARAGIRYVKKLFEQAGGDPALTAAGYYGGPGGLEKARRGVAVSDPRNPNAPTTLQYGQQVAARIPKEKGLVQRGVEAVIPSATAAEPAQGNPWDNDPIIEDAAPKPAAKPEGKSMMATATDAVTRALPGGTIINAIRGPGVDRDALKGFASGMADVGNTIINAGTKAAADFPDELRLNPQAQSDAQNVDRQAGLQSYNTENASPGFTGGRIAGNVAATYPVGGALGGIVKAAGAGSLGNAIASSGASGGNMLMRMLGGGISGGASAGLIDPSASGLGAGIGAALPPSIKAVGAAGNALGALVRPFYGAGQNQIVGNALRDFATNPNAARNALASAAEVVPGSAPIAATAAGDDGIAALSRAMQNASPEYASNLAARQTAQNQARTAALEGIAGNTGKIDLAKAARDSSTAPMREAVLDAAGKVQSQGILKSIDRLIAKPDNAGELSQQALNKFRGRIEQFSKNGEIDARALYEIRKDINTLLQGKLQGEAGNLKYASGQLGNVKSLIDDAIDEASRRVASPTSPVSTSREIVPFVPSTEIGAPAGTSLTVPRNAVGRPAMPRAAQDAAQSGPRPTWRGYLQSYADQSIPIRQMEKLDDILKAVQTGTVDSQGGAILSAAKLNNLLKNQGSDLIKNLSAEQLKVLRAIQADLNAGQIANNTGRAVGSNTVQNLAQNQLLQGALGKTLGGSTVANSTLGRLMQIPYGTANRQIQDRLGNALLNPQEAARLLAQPEQNALARALAGPAQLGYKAAPAISAR